VSDLAITSRCLEHDLLEVLQPEVAEHIVSVFCERRGQNPESGETMSGVGGPLRKLHADLSGGRSVRGVTWYDRGRDVCWLLAAGMHSDFYDEVERLAKTDSHLPTEGDIANFEADAPVRLIERVVRNARSALELALSQPGVDVHVTGTPPPRAYFRIEGDRLWVRIILYGRDGYRLTLKQLAAVQAAVYGNGPVERAVPDDAQWDSVYLAGRIPNMDDWPPAPQLI
jgi:hypothetical protein